MMMRGRQISFVLVALMTASLVACGGDDGGNADGDVGTSGDGDGDTSGDGDGDGDGDADAGEGSGCGGPGLGAGDTVLSLVHDGEMRQYTVHVPTGYTGDDPVPMVMNFHGRGSNMDQQIFFSNMNPTADANGFVVVYPQGLINDNDDNRTWNAGLCCADDSTRDDVGFTLAMVANLKSELCIDEDRIYATGMSNGGFMSYYLACEASDVFAAVAPVAGALGITPDACKPTRPVPLIHFHGTVDSLVAVQSAQDSVDAWNTMNGCAGAGDVTYDNGDTTCTSWTNCTAGDGNGDVTYCESVGVDHCWPGQSFCPFGSSTEDISANNEMWKFFVDHPMPAG